MFVPTVGRFAGTVLGLASLLMLLGCGLADYEAQIKKTRDRVKIFDEESRLLGDTIDNPGKQEGDNVVPVWPFDLYLRVPQGVSAKLGGDARYVGSGCRLPLYRYAGSGGLSVFVAAGALAEKNKETKETKDSKEARGDEWTPDAFRREMLLALKEYYRKEYKFFLDLPPGLPFKQDRRRPYNMQGEPLPEMAFEAASITDEVNKEAKEPSQFFLYTYQNPLLPRLTAIVYQVPRKRVEANDAALLKALEYSLKSLDTTDAPKKRAEFLRFKTKA